MNNEAFKKQLEKNQPGGYVLPSKPPETICKAEHIWEGVEKHLCLDFILLCLVH